MSDRLLTAAEVADLLGVSKSWVLREWQAGRLPGFRLTSRALRFRRDEIDAWLETHRGIAPAPNQLRAVR